MSAYSSRVTIACPEAMIADANHLACHLGESAADFETFKTANYQDSTGAKYAVCSTVVKPIFLEAATGVLPELPPHAEEVVDPAIAQRALDTLGQPGGILMVEDDDPQAALAAMGLSPIPQTDTTTA